MVRDAVKVQTFETIKSVIIMGSTPLSFNSESKQFTERTPMYRHEVI